MDDFESTGRNSRRELEEKWKDLTAHANWRQGLSCGRWQGETVKDRSRWPVTCWGSQAPSVTEFLHRRSICSLSVSMSASSMVPWQLLRHSRKAGRAHTTSHMRTSMLSPCCWLCIRFQHCISQTDPAGPPWHGCCITCLTDKLQTLLTFLKRLQESVRIFKNPWCRLVCSTNNPSTHQIRIIIVKKPYKCQGILF